MAKFVKIREAIERIQKLPERKRKIIFWLILIPIVIFSFFLYGKYVQKKLSEIKIEKIKKEFKIPELKEEFKKIPKIEIPKMR